MQLSQIEIINLWGKKKITLPFTDRVTFLTGINGSGKSTLLNIIYDTLDTPSSKGLPTTSKYRFWSAKADFSNGMAIQTAILPDIEQQKSREQLTNLREGKNNVHNFDELKEIEHFYQANEESQDTHQVNYSSEIKGHIILQSKELPDSTTIDSPVHNKPLAFLYQEDRETLHNIDKSSIDFSLSYWALYKNSIDGRFAYLRNAIQILESQNNSIASEFMLSNKSSQELEELATYKDWKKKSQSINTVLKLLNSYFLESNKELTRDNENKLTLQHIKTQERISWHLLSRGEKTLIYLFLVVFLYKDKVSVFLFDEPEISLHIKWQHNLIKDLSELAPNNQFIIATHSPSLVQNGWLGHCLELSEI